MKTNTTVIMSSMVVATILVVGALVLPYNYAMAGARHSVKSSFDFTSIKVNLEKKIKQQVESHAKGGDANGGSGGSSNGGNGGISSGGNGGERW